jgi:hypothetical protein
MKNLGKIIDKYENNESNENKKVKIYSRKETVLYGEMVRETIKAIYEIRIDNKKIETISKDYLTTFFILKEDRFQKDIEKFKECGFEIELIKE